MNPMDSQMSSLQMPNFEVPESPTDSKSKPKSKRGSVPDFIRNLISLASYIKQLEVQSHLIHFNYEKSNFFGVHAFLKDQYHAHVDQFDRIGEFVRSMDYLMPMCNRGLEDACPKFNHVKSYAANNMLITYYKNLEELGLMTKKVEQEAARVKAIDIQNYMAELCGEAFKAAWFIKASLRSE